MASYLGTLDLVSKHWLISIPIFALLQQYGYIIMNFFSQRKGKPAKEYQLLLFEKTVVLCDAKESKKSKLTESEEDIM